MKSVWTGCIGGFRIVALLAVTIALQLLPAAASAAPVELAVTTLQTTAGASAAKEVSAPTVGTQQSRYQFKSLSTGQCIAAHSGSNTMTFQYACNSAYLDQIWTWNNLNGPIVNVASGMCLAAHNSTGAVPFQHPCVDAYADQKWVRSQGYIKNVHSGLCIAVHPGSRPFMHPCKYTDQEWRVTGV
jgi:hypothetical protein